MTDEDFKKFQKLIKEETRPLKEIIEIIKQKVDKQELFLTATTSNIRAIKEQQSVMNEKLDGIEARLDDPDTGLKRLNDRTDANTGAVMQLEETVNGYGDMYKINDSNIRKMQKRLEPLEENAGIDVPPEFQLGNFA